MSRRDNAELRCGVCRLPRPLCVCSSLPSLAVCTRVLVVVHREEERKPTNTGLLAARCLRGARVAVVGDRARPLPARLLEEGERAVLLFPADDALPIARYADGAPLTLVVPDGNWRQAARIARRVPGLATLPRVALPPGPPTRYRLRAEPREGGLATLEAIARALAALEGEEVAVPLLELFARFVDRTLWLRGALPDAEVTGGVPAEAIASGVRGHRPRSS
ncbi:MAG: DTW domain-containing protein [Deltaproteobacteria bacterium]|nr:DTW domain-containing protein [Deltaproteobacteria bacterium]